MIEEHPAFGTFLAGSAAAATTAPASKAVASKKRKAADDETDAELVPKASSVDTKDSKFDEGKKKAPAKCKGRGKKVKTEEAEDVEKVKTEEENSADGGDGLGEFVYRRNVVEWLSGTDGIADEA